MNLTLKRSKQYVSILLGGYPADADKVMELVADPRQRLSFIYGIGIFVVYFYSDKPIGEIEKVFMATMRKQVDMIFIFRNTKNTTQHMAPHVRLKMETAEMERENVIGSDLNAMRDVLTAIGSQLQMIQNTPPMPQSYYPPQPLGEEAPASENDVLNQLLMKMKSTGYNSLSPAELDFLREYKDKHKNNNQNEENDVD